MNKEDTSTTLSTTESFQPVSTYEENPEIFWFFAITYLITALVTVVGNGVVLYASCRSKNFSRLSFFDGAIKSLAVADMLLGLVGIPCRVAGVYYIGM